MSSRTARRRSSRWPSSASRPRSAVCSTSTSPPPRCSSSSPRCSPPSSVGSVRSSVPWPPSSRSNYFFTAPRESLDVQKGDDLVALVAFAVGVGRAGLDGLAARRGAAHRRTARAGDPDPPRPHDPAHGRRGSRHRRRRRRRRAGRAVRPGPLHAAGAGGATTASGPGTPGRTTAVPIAPLDVEIIASREHPLGQSDRALLEALVAGLAAAIDRLRLEVEAREARIDAQVGRTRSGFLSAVTHNLRTPLASIKAASSTLRAPGLELDPTDRAELLDTIYDETERLERLVTNILELSRIRAGGARRVAPTGRPARPRPGRDPPAPSARPRPPHPARRARRPRRRRGRHRDDGAGLRQPARERAALRAARFRDPGVGRTPTDDPLGVVVRVADHGPGVPEAERERIFEEFARVDARPDSTGTGLGLAIVHALVTAHGGNVWCEETPGRGRDVRVRHPDRRRRQESRP